MSVPLQFASLYDGHEVFIWSDFLLNFGTGSLVGNMTLYGMHGIFWEHFISMRGENGNEDENVVILDISLDIDVGIDSWYAIITKPTRGRWDE